MQREVLEKMWACTRNEGEFNLQVHRKAEVRAVTKTLVRKYSAWECLLHPELLQQLPSNLFLSFWDAVAKHCLKSVNNLVELTNSVPEPDTKQLESQLTTTTTFI